MFTAATCRFTTMTTKCTTAAACLFAATNLQESGLLVLQKWEAVLPGNFAATKAISWRQIWLSFLQWESLQQISSYKRDLCRRNSVTASVVVAQVADQICSFNFLSMCSAVSRANAARAQDVVSNKSRYQRFVAWTKVVSSIYRHLHVCSKRKLSLQRRRIWLAHICLICCVSVCVWCVCVWIEREREGRRESVQRMWLRWCVDVKLCRVWENHLCNYFVTLFPLLLHDLVKRLELLRLGVWK